MRHLLASTGANEMIAIRQRRPRELHDTCPVVVVRSYNAVPARINKKEGGATPVCVVRVCV